MYDETLKGNEQIEEQLARLYRGQTDMKALWDAVLTITETRATGVAI